MGADANVSCRELGYKYGEAWCGHLGMYESPLTCAHGRKHEFGVYGSETRILVDNLNCSGTEDAIFYCDAGNYPGRPLPGTHNCNHQEDVAVKCVEPVNGTVCPVLRHDDDGNRDALIMSPSSGLMYYSVTLPSPLARTDNVVLSIMAGQIEVAKYKVAVGELMSTMDTCGRENDTAVVINKVLTTDMGRIEISIEPITRPFDCKATSIRAARHEPSSSFLPICIDEGDTCAEGPATSGAGGRTCDHRFCRSSKSDHIHEHGFGTQADTGQTRPLSRALGVGEAPLYVFSATLDREVDGEIAADCVDCIREGHHARPLFAANPPPAPARFGCVDWAELEKNEAAEYEVGVVFRGPRESSNLKTFPKCSFVSQSLQSLACVQPVGSDSEWYTKSLIIPPHCPVVDVAIGVGRPATFQFRDVVAEDPELALLEEAVNALQVALQKAMGRQAAFQEACAKFTAHKVALCTRVYGTGSGSCGAFNYWYSPVFVACFAFNSDVVTAQADVDAMRTAYDLIVANSKMYRPGLELVPDIRRAGLGLSFTIAFGEGSSLTPSEMGQSRCAA